MKYNDFLYVMNLYKKVSDQFSELHDIGIDFFEGKYKLSEDFYYLLNKLFETHYNEHGVDMINWFIFESKYGTNNLIATDENGDKICYSIESLHNYIEKNHKLKNDN